MTRSILLIVSALNGNVTTGRALFIAICERRVATENWQIYGSLCRKGGSRCGYFIVVLMNSVATRDGFIFSWIHRR